MADTSKTSAESNAPADKHAFLERLNKVLAGEDRSVVHEPIKDIEPGEIDLGAITNTVTRSLFSLTMDLTRRRKEFARQCVPVLEEVLKEAVLRMKKSPNETDKERIRAINQTLSSLSDQMELASRAFWYAVQDEFPQSRQGGLSVAIRRGWKVVVYKRASETSEDLLSSLIGSALLEIEKP